MQQQQIEEMYAVEASHWWFGGKRLLMRRLLGERLSQPGLRILDAGCGAGATAIEFSAYGRVCACDRSPDALRFVGERGLADRVAVEAPDLPFADESFDIVLAFDIIEHVGDDTAFIHELARVLRPGGALAIHVPAWPSLWSRHDEILEHRRRYTRRSLRALIDASGLRLERLTWSSCAIFLPTVAVRTIRRATGNEPASADLGVVPAPLNFLLKAIYGAEAAVAARVGLPFGVSLAAIAARDGERPTAPRNPATR